MARLTALPSLEIIRGLKGIIDFYLWKGLPCARAWPRWRPARQSEASKAAALFFGAVVKSYSLLGDLPLAAYRQDAAGQPRSARDLMVTGAYGNLHEASMSDFLTLLQQSRDFLSALTTVLNALDSVDLDQLVVNVDESVLPTGAATAAAQATQTTALQKLDDLQDALQSKHLDRLIVRGQDQLVSYRGALSLRLDHDKIGDGTYTMLFPDTPADEIHKVLFISVRNNNSVCTDILLYATINDILAPIGQFPDPVAGRYDVWQGEVWLDPGDKLTILFEGCLNGDALRAVALGNRMTPET